jgi:ribosome-associated protein
MATSHKKNDKTLQALKNCVHALEEKKAIDIQVLDISATSTITDYVILATGNSEPHLVALRSGLEETFKINDIQLNGVDYDHQSGWLAIDGFSFMVHLFSPSQREHYRLDLLFKDAQPVALND